MKDCVSPLSYIVWERKEEGWYVAIWESEQKEMTKKTLFSD